MPRVSRKSAAAAPTPAVSPPSSRPQRPPSPLSPHRISRQEEQEEMRGLNSRLANYIDLVRSLEQRNSALDRELFRALLALKTERDRLDEIARDVDAKIPAAN